MEDARWLRLVTIGLVLAAMAVGYFLLAQRFTGNKVSKSQPEGVISMSPQPTPSGQSVMGTNTGQATRSAYERIAERTRGGVRELPATGFPTLLIGIFSLGAIIAGFGLRKFPK